MTRTPTTPDPGICPGCDGPKSRSAELCKACRRRANAVGVSVVTHVHEAAIPPESQFVPRTPAQSRVYHGKCNDLARITKTEFTVTKRRALERASKTFGREITSSTELSEIEMELLLEWLDDEIAAAKQRALELVQ